MAWPPPPPPLSLDLSSPPDFMDDPPRRPSSAEFLKTAKERLQQQQHQQQQQHSPLSFSSSSMLLSPPYPKKSSTPTTEKRESAPPAFRTPASSTLSTSDNGLTNNSYNNGQPPKQRPRSGSHAQISPYSSSNTLRPLPALPTSKRSASLTPDDSIKVLVDDEGPLSSPHALNSNRLYPNGYTPQSPQFKPQGAGPGPSHHYTTINQGNGTSSGINQGRYVLEHQSSMSSNGSGSSKSRPSMSSLRPSSDLRGDSALDSGQTQEQVYKQGQGFGDSFGEGWQQHMSPHHHQQLHNHNHQQQQQQHPQLSPASTRGSHDGPADERSIQQQHLTHLLQDGAPAKPRRASSPLASPAVSSSPATSSMISLPHPSQRLPIHDVSSVSSPTASSSHSPTESATFRKLLKPTPTTTPHLSSQPLPNSNGLQPYYPPPPALSTNTRSNHLTESAVSSPHPSTHSTDRITGSPATMLTSTRSRRHSSSAGSLYIETQHLDSFRKGPGTADIGGPLGRKNLKNSLATLPTSKQPSPSSSSAQLLPRQSPHHLGIPSSTSPHPKPGQGSPSQVHGQYSQQQQHQYQYQHQHQHQQHHHHHPPPAPSSLHLQQHQLQQQHSSQRSQYQQQHQHQHLTVRSLNSPRPTSPLGSGVLDAFQDRTAMALMQRYLTSPDDPESEADVQMQIMISQAAVDSKGFEVLVPQSVESIKRHHATLSSRIAALTARLSLESKIREAAQSLLKLHADNKKLARQASDHLEAANRKVDQVATELWKLTQLAADLQRTLLQHTSGVLALGVVRLEDQGRREREAHALQLQEARVGKDVEEQFEAMSRTIMNLESDTLEAQSLLEDKDRAIERLMKQLDHQRELYVRLDGQQQKMMALSRSQQKDLDLLGNRKNDERVAELESFLGKVAGRLQGILQQQQEQQQQHRHQKQVSAGGGGVRKIGASGSEDQHRQENEERERNAQTWPSDATLLSKGSASTQDSQTKTKPGRVDSMSSSTRDGGNSNLSTTVVSDRTASSSQGSTLTTNDKNDDTTVAAQPQHVSKERIFSTLDALDHFMTEAQQKSQILEGEIGLLRRQSVALSESRNNSIKIKNFSSVRGQAAEETIRSALEKSLKDALLEKEIARQELENERQRWQDDQNHRISALEESLVAVEDSDKSTTGKPSSSSSEADSDRAYSSQQDEETIRTLRRQLHEAIDEIDTLSQQHQSSLKSMRQLFDLIPDSRRKSHFHLFAAQQQQQRNGGTGGSGSGRASPAGSISSVSSGNAAIGFSMETLIAHVRELVLKSQQLEQQQQQDPVEAKHPKAARSRQTSNQGSVLLPPSQADLDHQQQLQQQQDSTWISNSELERLQANAGMIQLLEKEIELLKQHTDMLLDENARLAEMAAATATSVSHPASRSSADLRAMIRPPSKDDALDELHEIIRVKDTLLRERDEMVELQEKALLQVRSELTLAVQANEGRKNSPPGGSDSPSSPPAPLSSFDVVALEDFRVQCDRLEEQNGEMRMIVAALEAAHGGPGSGAQLLKTLQSTSNTPSSPTSTASWLSSRLSSGGSLSFGSLTQKLAAPTPEPTTSSSSSNINTPIPSSIDAFSNSSSSHSPSLSSLQPAAAVGAGGFSGGGSNAAITSATAALRKEFRRVMTELREEKEKAVRKEVEERRKLERTVRQLRRELQAVQNSEITTA